MEEKKSFLLNQTEKYHDLINNTYGRLEKEQFDKDLSALFVMACSSGLEYFLNSIYINFTYETFKDYKDYAYGFINLSFKNKLVLAAPTVSNNKLVFNEDNREFKQLKRLISRRNEILHNKDYVVDMNVVLAAEYEETLEMEISMDDLTKALKNHIDSIDTEECKEYKNAINIFCSDFLFPYNKKELKPTNLLIENANVKE